MNDSILAAYDYLHLNGNFSNGGNQPVQIINGSINMGRNSYSTEFLMMNNSSVQFIVFE